MSLSRIEWTETTWNPVTGCSKISAGCENCYAEIMAKRLQAMGQKNYINGFKLTLHDDIISQPLLWKKSKMIFVNSMSDIFHEDIPESFIIKIFATMRLAKQHTFQLLTKRAKRLSKLATRLHWPQNIWMGVTVESRKHFDRISDLIATEAYVKFISFEPLLDDVYNVPLQNVDWVIVGGESGPKARPMESEWVDNIFQQCQSSNTPFFFKQWGGKNKKKTGRLLNGRTWDQMPNK